MECNDRETANKLSDYFLGRLSRDEMTQVTRHLSECQQCRASLKTMLVLAGRATNTSPRDLERHLSTELLTTYYENKESLDEQTLKKIESHLASCERCSYDLHFLTSLEEDLELSVESVTEHESVLVRFFNSFLKVIRKPALAYFLLMLTVYPAIKWVARSAGGDRSDAIAYLPHHEYTVVGRTRSGGEIPTVFRPHNKSIVAMAVPYHHATKEFSYRISFNDESDSVPVKLETIIDFSETGVIKMLVQTRSAPDGTYLLTILEADREEPSDILRSKYLFHLKTE